MDAHTTHRPQLGVTIGKGSFGEVFAAAYQGLEVAVKRCEDVSPLMQAAVESEMQLMKSLPPHPNIVRFYGAAEHKHCVWFVMELVTAGSLHELLYSEAGKRKLLSLRQRLQIAAGIALGLQCLHTASPPIIHRDIKVRRSHIAPLTNKPHTHARAQTERTHMHAHTRAHTRSRTR